MLKKTLVICLLSAASYAQSATKVEKCESMITGGVYNDLLENFCGFDGGVTDGFKQAYARNGCPDLIPEKRIFKLGNDVGVDTDNRIQAFGKRKFCEQNLETYADLSNAFQQGINIFNQNTFKQRANAK